MGWAQNSLVTVDRAARMLNYNYEYHISNMLIRLAFSRLLIAAAVERSAHLPDELAVVNEARGLAYYFDKALQPRCSAGRKASGYIQLDGLRELAGVCQPRQEFRHYSAE
jgi:hypothetical protein